MTRFLQFTTYLSISIAAFLILLILGKPVIIPLVFALLFALLLLPLAKTFEKWFKKRWISILLTLLIAPLPFILAFYLFGAQLANAIQELPDLTKKVNDFMNQGFKLISQYIPTGGQNSEEWIKDKIGENQSQLIGFFTQGLTLSSSVLTAFVLIPLFTFLLLFYRNGIKNFFIQQVSKDSEDEVRDILSGIKEITQNYIVGLFFVVVILGVLNSIGLLIIGVKYAVFWGFFAASLAIVPYIGAFIGGFFPFVYALMTLDGYWPAISVVILFAVIQTVEGNFITPKVVGDKINVNPLAAIIGLLVGSMIWGIIGMLLSLPILAIVKVIFDHVDVLKPYGYLLGDSLASDRNKCTRQWNKPKYRLFK